MERASAKPATAFQVVFDTTSEQVDTDDGFEVRDEELARLSPFVRHHINVLGRYSFQLPDLPGGLRLLRDKTAVEEP
ncbi:hypothetical protein ACFZBU_06690 [Embleya sp. NPDC008237]|uniref:hypothetical protein n=1 Tax=Embleya sp. NPDC008237 TaxID=3363978 RepID=UPI0036E4A7CB